MWIHVQYVNISNSLKTFFHFIYDVYTLKILKVIVLLYVKMGFNRANNKNLHVAIVFTELTS